MRRHQKEEISPKIPKRRFGEIKVFGLRGVLRLLNGVSYALRGMNSSYFDFIPTFWLNWDNFEAEFGLSFGWFLCHFMACFVALIRKVLVAGFVVLLGMGLGLV